MDNLINLLTTAGLVEDGMIVLERYEDGTIRQTVDVETFSGFFAAAVDSATPGSEYDMLVAADQGKGYSRFFDQWHAAGIL
ncbi:MAG: hypothetical protein ABFD64_09870 [Armatimonadota bacterium]